MDIFKIKEELKKEFGPWIILEIEDDAAWEDARVSGFAQAHYLWDAYEATFDEFIKFKICHDYRRFVGY